MRPHVRRRTALDPIERAASEEVAATPIAFVAHPDFTLRKEAGDLPPAERLPAEIDAPRDGMSPYLARLYETPLLTHDQERTLFTRMNWLKYRAEQVRRTIRPAQPSLKKVREVQRLIAEANRVRNRIVQANLRLVVSLARKFTDARHSLDDLVSEGHFPLIRAVELFDVSRGFRFSTYATWAVRNHLVRCVTQSKTRVEAAGWSDADLFEAPDHREPDAGDKVVIERQRRLMTDLLPRLPVREQHVMQARFGLNDHDRAQTLSEIAGELGLSKERVRQLVMSAIDQLREYAAELKAKE